MAAKASVEPQARLYVLLARRAPRAVIFRRGPSKQVALLTWNTRTDELVCGQWLKGRIYERRCDLSPDGELLVYFAATWKRRHVHGSWTAVSRAPWFTALALWPKGDAWGGGGLWARDRQLLLHHAPHQLAREAGARALPKKLQVTRPEWGGYGEDDPIQHERRVRDGWVLRQQSQHSHFQWGLDPTFRLDPPTIYAKGAPGAPGVELELSCSGLGERGGSWHVETARLRAGRRELDLGRVDWADWDPLHRSLLWATGGRLWRLPARAASELDGDARAEVADLRKLAFVARTSPAEAQRWP